MLADVDSPTRVRFTHEVGAQFPPVFANSGRLLSAYLSPEKLDEHLSNDPEYAGLTKAQKLSFAEDVKRTRRGRCAISSSEERAGMKDLAVLVGNPAIDITAALAIACLAGGKDKEDINRLVTALQERGGKITGTLALSHD